MPERVTVRGEGVDVLIELGEGTVPEELLRRLPQESKARIESGAVHFPILVPLAAEPADRGEVGTGDVTYLPENNALCLVYDADGNDRDPEDATKVGRIVGGIEACRSVKANQTLRLEAAQ
jgi:hypothetical protein